jgi:hypothetical protein
MIIGELALGGLKQRTIVLSALGQLPGVNIASHDEVMHLVEARGLNGKGLNLVNAHLLAAAILTPGLSVWTRDKSLRAAARMCGISALTGLHD